MAGSLLYRTCLRQWALLTGDPPLQEISDELLAALQGALATTIATGSVND